MMMRILGRIILYSLFRSFANIRYILLYSHDMLTLDEVSDALHAKEKMKLMVFSKGYSNSPSKGDKFLQV
jgi:hypothetical protein